MSDIVEQLHEKLQGYYTNDTGGSFGMGPVLRDAIEEIERLRDQVATLTERAVFAEAYMRGK